MGSNCAKAISFQGTTARQLLSYVFVTIVIPCCLLCCSKASAERSILKRRAAVCVWQTAHVQRHGCGMLNRSYTIMLLQFAMFLESLSDLGKKEKKCSKDAWPICSQ